MSAVSPATFAQRFNRRPLPPVERREEWARGSDTDAVERILITRGPTRTDRLNNSVNVYAWFQRQAHASGSGAGRTTRAQLVRAFFPAPPKDRTELEARWGSIKRWIGDLVGAEMLELRAERDEDGAFRCLYWALPKELPALDSLASRGCSSVGWGDSACAPLAPREHVSGPRPRVRVERIKETRKQARQRRMSPYHRGAGRHTRPRFRVFYLTEKCLFPSGHGGGRAFSTGPSPCFAVVREREGPPPPADPVEMATRWWGWSFEGPPRLSAERSAQLERGWRRMALYGGPEQTRDRHAPERWLRDRIELVALDVERGRREAPFSLAYFALALDRESRRLRRERKRRLRKEQQCLSPQPPHPRAYPPSSSTSSASTGSRSAATSTPSPTGSPPC